MGSDTNTGQAKVCQAYIIVALLRPDQRREAADAALNSITGIYGEHRAVTLFQPDASYDADGHTATVIGSAHPVHPQEFRHDLVTRMLAVQRKADGLEGIELKGPIAVDVEKFTEYDGPSELMERIGLAANEVLSRP